MVRYLVSAAARKDANWRNTLSSSRLRWFVVVIFTACALLAALVVTQCYDCARGIRQPELDMIAEMLHLGRLASLPGSAANVTCDGVANAFSAQYALRFQAEPADIDAFVSASASLKGVSPELFSKSHQYIPYNETVGDSSTLEHHATFLLQQRFPWFVPVVRERGRRYSIEQDRRGVWGEVVIDDVKSIVYVLLSRS
jgi:hypothetical protein